MKPTPRRERDDQHEQVRTVLRLLGPFVVLVGLTFLLFGAVDFFSSFGSFEPPTLFWCFFVGMPILAVGGWICQLAYMGSLHRYVSRETTPVLRDTFNDLAEGTGGGVRTIARALGEGFAEARGRREAGDEVSCARCGASVPGDASFCDQCGSALAAPSCPRCGQAGDPDARFCRHCGAQLR